MISELLIHWSEYNAAAQKVLSLAQRSLRIFDANLSRLDLERRENVLALRDFLTAAPQNTIQIVLRDTRSFCNESPRLFRLLADFPHALQVWECAHSLLSLTDAMLLADESHALIRVHEDHARSRLITDDAPACRVYLTRFKEILKEGGTPISATTLGL
jgi:hypothetical protein